MLFSEFKSAPSRNTKFNFCIKNLVWIAIVSQKFYKNIIFYTSIELYNDGSFL